jgi:hypothetical protein
MRPDRFCRGLCASLRNRVFPTRVGVYRTEDAHTAPNLRFPHASGGVPMNAGEMEGKFSPREWGCIAVGELFLLPTIVFPTRVGVYPSGHWVSMVVRSFPHSGGGVTTKAPPGSYPCVAGVYRSNRNHVDLPTL